MFFKAFIYGILAAFGALLAELVVLYFLFPDYFSGQDAGYAAAPLFLLTAAAIEELSKFVFIWKLKSLENQNFELYKTAPFVGIGLFALEFAFKRSVLFEGSYWPFAGIFMIHTATAFTLGYFLQKVPGKKILLTGVILFNISIHFAYNFIILKMN